MPWSPRAARALAIVLIAGVIVAGFWWWQGRTRTVLPAPSASSTAHPSASPAMSSSTRTPAPSVAAIVVQVIGRVRNPGVYELPAGSRVTDAIDAAGGIRSGATSGRLNLARVLVDGEQIDVGRDTQAPAPSVAQPGTPTPSAGPLDLNAATSADLEALPGVGPVLAQRIVDWRTQNGPFPSVDVLGEVPGIGDVMLERLRPLVVVR